MRREQWWYVGDRERNIGKPFGKLFAKSSAAAPGSSIASDTTWRGLNDGIVVDVGQHIYVHPLARSSGFTTELPYISGTMQDPSGEQILAKANDNGTVSLDGTKYNSSSCFIGNTNGTIFRLFMGDSIDASEPDNQNVVLYELSKNECEAIEEISLKEMGGLSHQCLKKMVVFHGVCGCFDVALVALRRYTENSKHAIMPYNFS
jgi:hypothetical protein